MKKMIFSLLLIITFISCEKEDQGTTETPDLKNIPTVEDPVPTIMGLWQHGPHELKQPMPNPMDFTRVEISIMPIPICNIAKLMDNFTLEQMEKVFFFHFKEENLLNVTMAISVPSIDYLCQTEGRSNAAYEIDEEGALQIESAGSLTYIGLIDLVSYREMRLFTGPI